MPLKSKFNKFTTVSPILTSFSFEDIISGQGIAEFFPYNAHSNTTPTTVYKISDKSSIYSNSTGTSGVNTSLYPTFALISTTTFDSSTFNDRRVAEGTATANITNFSTGSGGESAYCYVDVSLYHWDGSTETQIGATVRSNTTDVVDATQYKVNAMVFTIPKTIFKKGNILRTKVAIYGASTASRSMTKGFLHDPVGRTVGTAESSQFSIKLPFNKI